MTNRTLKILAVCGSGVVSSSMIVTQIKDILGAHNIKVQTFELMPQMVKSHLERNEADLVVATTKVPGDIDIPIINAVALLSGMGKEQFVEELVTTAKKILDEGNGG
ncbi:MAG: PTS sugar transporter subunit IIB [Chloroflexi bacterium]|nr:PTS sugar transporter subunit IIB [Chloroflexota bacterium]